MSAINIIAHRGASFDAPENTLASINLAWEQNADAVEVDVHLSKDNEVVVIHDYDTGRTTGIFEPVKNQTLSELKLLDAGSWKDHKWRMEKIPSLREVLRIVPENKRIFIEIKNDPDCLVPVKNLLSEISLHHSQIVIMDFNFETVVKARGMFPDIEVLWLHEFIGETNDEIISKRLDEVISIAAKHKFHGVNIENVSAVNKSFIDKTKAMGLKCYCWTVDDPFRAKELVENGIDGLTTNRPGWLRKKILKMIH